MNSFANALFTAFFSWLKSVVQMIYRAVAQPGSGTLLTFIADHWVMLLIIVLVVGTALDLTVYMFRWRPYEVWASFFRRVKYRRKHRGRGETQHVKREMHMVASVPEDDAYVIPDTGLQRTPETLTYVDPQTDIEFRTENEPAEEIPVTGEITALEEDEKPRRRRAKPQARKGIRHLIRRILAEEEEETVPLRHSVVQPPVDERDAYGDPYIPPQWKMPEDRIVRNKRSEREKADE